jgi:hypothetical protein
LRFTVTLHDSRDIVLHGTAEGLQQEAHTKGF